MFVELTCLCCLDSPSDSRSNVRQIYRACRLSIELRESNKLPPKLAKAHRLIIISIGWPSSQKVRRKRLLLLVELGKSAIVMI